MVSCHEKNSYLVTGEKPKLGKGLYGNFYFIVNLENGSTKTMRAEIISKDNSSISSVSAVNFSEIETLSCILDSPVLCTDYKNRLVVLGRIGSIQILSKEGKKWVEQKVQIPITKSLITCQISGGQYYDLSNSSRIYIGSLNTKIFVLKRESNNKKYIRDHEQEKFVNSSLLKLISNHPNIIIDQVNLNGILLSINERYLYVHLE
ncbi:hypothetical protein AYI70_g6230 [Smittium culicis]|uniref:Uncharacterized protein n=1 Tax=Smittium culicis TaxID=133412 RepID=A0A1R1XQV8_9FUNG|nr:hypothetical protein AYI70_g6230 [Smittium culicis]